jgi:asparagine synthase (glutamine-hydrolysing)
MCGIAGIVSPETVSELHVPLLRMQNALVHRGPDGSGIWTNADQSVGFAHRRLAIIDLTAAGHQPMTSPDGRFTIAFNGEIFNFRELRTELRANGVEFRSESDTEVILRLYERDGPDSVRRLRGMFAFALWDSHLRTCLLARDPLGIKPLYFSASPTGSGNRLIFASEIRALVASGVVAAAIDSRALLGYLRTGSVPEPMTMLRNVECLAAGSILVWRDGSVHRQVYWEFPLARADGDESDAGRQVPSVQLRTALLDTIRAHYVSDVPVGVFLSGGIDSTAVVALSRAAGKEDVRTFSMSFAEPGFDEAPVARRTAAAFGTSHHEWLVDSAAAGELLDEFFTCLDQPTVDGFNTWCVARMAHKQGMKVVLSGLGGDELFAGYPTFRQVPALAIAGAVPRPVRAPIGRLLESAARSPQRRRLGEFLAGRGAIEDAWMASRSIFTRRETQRLAAWLSGEDEATFAFPSAPSDGAFTPEPAAASVSRLEVTRFMRNQLLRDGDVMSMAWGLELRVPFVDQLLIEAVVRIPVRDRLAYGKKLLIAAVPELPDWVVDRTKTGFQFPFARWIHGGWRERFEAVGRGSPVPLETWYRKWLLLAFQEWRTNLARLVPAAPSAGRA